MKKTFIMIFLSACTTKNLNNNAIDFNKNLSFDEFKVLLIEYDKNKGFPKFNK